MRSILEALSFFYVIISSKQFLQGRKLPIYFFSETPLRHLFSFNSITAINKETRFFADKTNCLCVLFIKTEDGLSALQTLSRELIESSVIFMPRRIMSKAHMLTDWGIPQIGSIPFSTFSATYRFPQDPFKPIHLYFAVCFFWIVGFSMKSFYPKDDLLRHTVSYLWNYDYSIPYIYTTFSPSFDLYFSFDHVMAPLHQLLGENALIVPQLFALTLTFWGLTRFMRDADNNITLICLIIVMQYTAGRFMLGRPSIVCSSVMLFLMAYDKEVSMPIKLTAAALMSTLYYLSFIYLLPLILINRKYFLSFAAAVLFWLIYSHGAFITEIPAVIATLNKANVGITETKTILGFYLTMFVYAFPMLHYWRKDVKKALTVLYFSLTNQVRYVETVLPLLMSFFRFVSIKITPAITLGIIIMMISLFPWAPQDIIEDLHKHIPERSKVLTESMNTMYQLLFKKPSLQIAPSYAYGLTEPNIQELVKKVSSGTLDCSAPALHRFDYMVEESLKGSLFPCLDLVSVERGKRLWKIKG
jgi:hypothetical protein